MFKLDLNAVTTRINSTWLVTVESTLPVSIAPQSEFQNPFTCILRHGVTYLLTHNIAAAVACQLANLRNEILRRAGRVQRGGHGHSAARRRFQRRVYLPRR